MSLGLSSWESQSGLGFTRLIPLGRYTSVWWTKKQRAYLQYIPLTSRPLVQEGSDSRSKWSLPRLSFYLLGTFVPLLLFEHIPSRQDSVPGQSQRTNCKCEQSRQSLENLVSRLFSQPEERHHLTQHMRTFIKDGHWHIKSPFVRSNNNMVLPLALLLRRDIKKRPEHKSKQ